MNHISSDCRERYILNQLSGDDLSQVEEHLLICEECRDALEEHKRFITAVSQALATETEPYTERRKVVAIDSRKTQQH